LDFGVANILIYGSRAIAAIPDMEPNARTIPMANFSLLTMRVLRKMKKGRVRNVQSVMMVSNKVPNVSVDATLEDGEKDHSNTPKSRDPDCRVYNISGPWSLNDL
jgi:hypothetical protein